MFQIGTAAYSRSIGLSVNLLNALVIYFAVGAPFGVLSISRGRLFAGPSVRPFVDLVFWPFTAISVLADAVVDLWSNTIEEAVGGPTSNLPAATSSTGRTDLLAARRTLEMRAGIQLALDNARHIDTIEAPFLDGIDHPRSDIAAKCFNRRNIARLENHLDRLNS